MSTDLFKRTKKKRTKTRTRVMGDIWELRLQSVLENSLTCPSAS